MKGVNILITEKVKNDVFYVCTLIEYIGRYTNNHRGYVVEKMGKEGIRHQLEYASINHCLSIEQVGEEVIEDYNIEYGSFDTIRLCKYSIPSITNIGKLYQRLVLDTLSEDTLEDAIYKVFHSFLSDEVSDFNSNVYYSSPDYLKCSYLEGQLL